MPNTKLKGEKINQDLVKLKKLLDGLPIPKDQKFYCGMCGQPLSADHACNLYDK